MYVYMYEYEPTKVSILSKVCTSGASMHIGVEFVDMVHVYSNIYSIVDMHIYIYIVDTDTERKWMMLLNFYIVKF